MKMMTMGIFKEKLWGKIESLNKKAGITRENSYLDSNGYLRWKENDRLCHRDIAYKEIYIPEGGESFFGMKFSLFEVHHKDRNVLNNDVENLELLTGYEHKKRHGDIIEYHNKSYHKLCSKGKIHRRTLKSYQIASIWIPRSLTIIRNDYIFVEIWFYNKNNLVNI